MRALYNSLEFVRENFEREVAVPSPTHSTTNIEEKTFFLQGERNFLMQVVCEATQNSSIEVQVAAFECLVRIMGLYYDKMNFYMERALFGVSDSSTPMKENARGFSDRSSSIAHYSRHEKPRGTSGPPSCRILVYSLRRGG